ncbi:MAG: isoprenylcysteine carboxylmethyltransferase family protein [Mycobacterium sp.]|nr:isoprenylcysteine carboxylmethyltransferase family protein [Mycobacterium sp.]
MQSGLKSAVSSVVGLGCLALLVFIPARTVNYWQAWVFLGVLVCVTIPPTIHLRRIDPAAFQRRRKAGLRAEARTIQKFVVTALQANFAAVLVVSGFDHRFGWSGVPTVVVLLGDVLVALGLGGAMMVIFENRYAAATVTIEDGQKLTTTGLYGIVRHPMYSASLLMMVGMPLALGSYWALLAVVPGTALLVLRILDEEKLLTQQLDGYADYTREVRYRLLPPVW